MQRNERAFTLAELGGSLVMLAILGAIAISALSENRRHARLGEDLASLQRFAAATSHYVADNEDRLWTFTWKGGETYLMMDLNGDLVPTVMPADDVGAGARQAVHLLRSLAGRIGEQGMPLINAWIPHVTYSHLPLQDYLDQDPTGRWTVSAADNVRVDWKDDPINKFDQGFWLPLQPDPTPLNRRWPYSGGFELAPAAWDFGQSELGVKFNGKRTQQGSQHNFYVIPGNVMVSGRTMSDVSYPGAKVQLYDSHQRHFGPKIYFFGVKEAAGASPAPARIPVLMFDGAADVRATRDCNPGWRPNTPTFACMTYWYAPSAWEPATTNGEELEFSAGFYRWTRGGLKGVDFGGIPLDTGQADPGQCDL